MEALWTVRLKINDCGFPNHFFSDPWVTGFGRAGHADSDDAEKILILLHMLFLQNEAKVFVNHMMDQIRPRGLASQGLLLALFGHQASFKNRRGAQGSIPILGPALASSRSTFRCGNCRHVQAHDDFHEEARQVPFRRPIVQRGGRRKPVGGQARGSCSSASVPKAAKITCPTLTWGLNARRATPLLRYSLKWQATGDCSVKKIFHHRDWS